VESFETLKKTEDGANEAPWQRLEDDATSHRALVTARRMKRQAVEMPLRREGGKNGSGPSGSM
jgi:hypothetical protein